MTDDLAYTGALEQAALVRAGDLSPLDLVDLYLDRIEALNPKLDAYLTVAADHAREQARAKTGATGDLPPFHGVPISVKDLNSTAGIRTTSGTAAWHDRVPDFDDEVVKRIKAAGFVVLGKTNTPEFGSRATTESPHYPPARNPWDTSRTPGGSSGGAAAACAAGLCPIAQGSDGGGSIRIPSAWCGLFGMKPSRGRVSSAPGIQSFYATNGFLARTVADSAAALDAVAGPAPGDAWWAPPPARPFLAEVGADPGRLRIAFTAAHPDGTTEVAEAWRAAVTETATLLDSLGHDLVEDAPEPLVLVNTAAAAAGFMAAADWPARETLDPVNQTVLAIGEAATAKEMARSMIDIQLWIRRVAPFFERYDVLLSPTLAGPPPRIGDRIMGTEDSLDALMEVTRLVAFTPTWNQSGQPTMAVPSGFDADGLPVSVQCVGRAADEATLFRLGAQLEAARPWASARPPVA